MFSLFLKESRIKNIHNPTLINENRLGVALKSLNFQVGFSDKICFFSSNFISFIFIIWRFEFPQSRLDLYFDFLKSFEIKTNHSKGRKMCGIICLKEIDSDRFFYLHSSHIQVLSEIGRIESWKCEGEKYLFLRPHINQF